MTTSPTWSVLNDGWESKGKSTGLYYVNTVLPSNTLREGGLKKKKDLQRGAQGAVYVACDTTRGEGKELVAVKRLFKQPNQFGRHGVAETVLREATLTAYITQQVLRSPVELPARPVELYRIVEAPYDELCLVMELCDVDLRRMVVPSTKGAPRCPMLGSVDTIRYLLRRVVGMIHFLHQECRIVHRDIKLSNILVKASGELRLSDFGSSRFLVGAQGDGGDQVEKAQYTPPSHRTTMMYQPLESLLGSRASGTELDVWSLGVLFAELVLQDHLFKASSELGIVSAIYKLLGGVVNWERDGPPGTEVKERSDPGTLALKFPPSLLPPEGLDLLRRMLTLDPETRITTDAILQHPFLTGEGANDERTAECLWKEKVEQTMEEKNKVVKVKMGKLSFGLEEGSEEEEEKDEDDDDDDVVVPPGFRLS